MEHTQKNTLRFLNIFLFAAFTIFAGCEEQHQVKDQAEEFKQGFDKLLEEKGFEQITVDNVTFMQLRLENGRKFDTQKLHDEIKSFMETQGFTLGKKETSERASYALFKKSLAPYPTDNGDTKCVRMIETFYQGDLCWLDVVWFECDGVISTINIQNCTTCWNGFQGCNTIH